jgi:hypothetical protein
MSKIKRSEWEWRQNKKMKPDKYLQKYRCNGDRKDGIHDENRAYENNATNESCLHIQIGDKNEHSCKKK